MKIEDMEFEPPDKCLNLEPDVFIKAQEGNSFAQLDIGKAYYDAPHVNDNLENAFKWIMCAAQQQNSEAQFKLGDLYAFGTMSSLVINGIIANFYGEIKAETSSFYYLGERISMVAF
ncbi:hypothetical protein K501DRAFT_280057 [Backusella circina FSU 941]|nr:hypothetical protein K501DRAFT_280057 [Backusella circina FSU 941]